MKLCKDCKWYRRKYSSSGFRYDHGCTFDPVTGPSRYCTDSAYENRANVASCGPDAKWFEPKENEK